VGKDVFTSGQVAEQVNMPRWRFLYLIEKELLPGPSFQVPGRRLFTGEDVAAIALALENRPELKQEAHHGKQ
jgi:hypothetical protein